MKKNFLVLGMALCAWMFLVTASHASPTPPGHDFEMFTEGPADVEATDGLVNGWPHQNKYSKNDLPYQGNSYKISDYPENNKQDHPYQGNSYKISDRPGNGNHGNGHDNGCGGHTPPAVPIPGVAWLLGASMTGLAALRRYI